MKQINNFETIKETSTGIAPGAYICKIVDVEDLTEKQYLKIFFDIADGDFKDYYSILEQRSHNWYGVIYRSYKDSALPYFKSFITAVEKSNPQFTWRWDEKELKGKYIVVVLGEEEYDDEGEIKVSIRPQDVRSLPALRDGKIKVPSLKKLTVTNTKTEQPVIEVKNEDLPF